MGNIMTPKMKVVDKAILAYEAIVEACSRPDKSISGENLSIYEDLVDWGFPDKYPITDPIHKWLYVTVIAMNLSYIGYKTVETTDSAHVKDGGVKWQIIQAALEKANKGKLKKGE